jgi:hypothetical protein
LPLQVFVVIFWLASIDRAHHNISSLQVGLGIKTIGSGDVTQSN